LLQSVFSCMCPKERWWSKSGASGDTPWHRPMAHYGVGPPPSLWWTLGCSRVWVWCHFVHLSIDISMVSQQSMWSLFSALHLELTWNQWWRRLGSVFLALGVDQWCGRGPWGARRHQVGLLPHPVGLDPPTTSTCLLMLDIWHFCIVFLHEQSSPSTSGTRSIININHYLCCCLLPFLVQCWWSK
jgi:hypothetical protein